MLGTKVFPTLAAVAFVFMTLPAFAQRDGLNIRGCQDAVGTYMTNRKSQQDGKTRTDRGLIAITNGGYAFVTDSAEGGLKGYQPFSDGSGVWRCLGKQDGKDRLKIITFDFTTTPDAETNRYIARVTVEAVADLEAGIISGKSLVEFLAIDAAPDTTDTVRSPVSYEFTGVKLKVSE